MLLKLKNKKSIIGKKRKASYQVTILQNSFVNKINRACDNLVPVSNFYKS